MATFTLRELLTTTETITVGDLMLSDFRGIMEQTPLAAASG